MYRGSLSGGGLAAGLSRRWTGGWWPDIRQGAGVCRRRQVRQVRECAHLPAVDCRVLARLPAPALSPSLIPIACLSVMIDRSPAHDVGLRLDTDNLYVDYQ
jgi:hypothetical protein